MNRRALRVDLHWASALSVLLVAASLRGLPLLTHRFHPDEALYASFARLVASGRDPLLTSVVVDKPPLSIYLNALSVLLFGGNEFAVRLPTYFASVVSVALLLALARRLYAAPAAHLAAWLFALSPFAILFSITVFIDPLLTALILWGWWAATQREPRALALAFALAFATKQTALLFLPLSLALYLVRLPRPGADDFPATLRQLWIALRAILIGLFICLLIIFGWDLIRQGPIGFWSQGYSDNVPNRLIRANELIPRLQAWFALLHYFTASRVFNLILLLGLPFLLWRSFRSPSRAALADLLITNYVLLYLALYTFLPFPVWDRYLVPLIPLLALVAARGLWQLAYGLWRIAHHFSFFTFQFSPRLGIWVLGFGNLSLDLLPVMLCLLLIQPALTAMRSGYPIGGDHGAYAGIDDAARFIHTLPTGGVLYDHWLSWEWNFYLFDGPLYVAWFPTPAALAADLQSFGRASPRYLAVPSWEADSELRAAAAQVGFEFIPVHTSLWADGSPAFTIYQLAPPTLQP